MIIQASPGLKQVHQVSQGQITQNQIQQVHQIQDGQHIQQEMQHIVQQDVGHEQLMQSEQLMQVDQLNADELNDSMEDGEALQVQQEETVVTSEPSDEHLEALTNEKSSDEIAT